MIKNVVNRSELLRKVITTFFIPLILSVVIGLIFVSATAAGSKWLFLTICGLLAITVGLLFSDKRFYLVLLLTLCAQVGFMYKLLGGNKYSLITHHGGALGEPVINLVDFPIIILFFLWLFDIVTNRKNLPKWNHLDNLIIAFLLISLLSLLTTDEYALLFFEIFRYLKYLLVYWILRTYINTPDYIWGILSTSIFMLSIHGIISLLQYFFLFQLPIPVGGVKGSDFELINNILIQRVTGILGHTNTFAAYLSIVVAYAFSLFFMRISNWIKIVTVPFFILGSISLILTFSRNSWLVLCLNVLIIIYFSHSTRRLFPALIFGTALLGSFIFGILVVSGIYEPIMVRVFESSDKAMYSRWDLITVAWEMIKEHPLVGIGLNSFQENMIYYDIQKITNVIQQPVHNIYMLVAAESGIPSLIIFLFILFQFVKYSHQLIKIDSELSFTVGIIGLTTFVGLGFSNLFDMTLRKEPIIGIVVLIGAVIVSMRDNMIESRQD